ncbi:rod shape-determining protein, partial [Halomonas sp. MG34]|nr:rod shape-determining protein [Halomonas sp. MG34]
EELKVPVLVADEPMHCVAKGTGIMLENIDKLERRKVV